MITTILIWIGAIVCIIGSSTIILLGLMVVRDFIIENFYGYKLKDIEESYKYETQRLAVLHLHKLKEKYPELEITYNDEILGEEE